MSQKISRKVTVFVLRQFQGQIEILLINHPHTDYQFPAGTIKNREEARDACLREVNEETGLENLEIIKESDPRVKEYVNYARLIKKAKLYARPTKYTTTFGKLKTGMKVKVLREKDNFVQIQYKEKDLLKPTKPVMLQLRGWVKRSKLGRKEIRHFFVVKSNDTQTKPWVVIADHHKFTLEWHPIDELLKHQIVLAGKQQQWFNRCKDDIQDAVHLMI